MSLSPARHSSFTFPLASIQFRNGSRQNPTSKSTHDKSDVKQTATRRRSPDRLWAKVPARHPTLFHSTSILVCALEVQFSSFPWTEDIADRARMKRANAANEFAPEWHQPCAHSSERSLRPLTS